MISKLAKMGVRKSFGEAFLRVMSGANWSRLWSGFSSANLRERRCEKAIKIVAC